MEEGAAVARLPWQRRAREVPRVRYASAAQTVVEKCAVVTGSVGAVPPGENANVTTHFAQAAKGVHSNALVVQRYKGAWFGMPRYNGW